VIFAMYTELLTILQMIFPIHLKLGSRIFHRWCELTEKGQTFEKFTFWPKDNPYKTIVLQNNRPTNNVSSPKLRNAT
jgi:hypothetical protein